MIRCFEDTFAYFHPCGWRIDRIVLATFLSKPAICHH